MALPVSFRWDSAFVVEIDRVRGDVPRSVFVRRAVERALELQSMAVEDSPASAEQPEMSLGAFLERWEMPPLDPSAPAEQPVRRRGPDVEAFRRATQKP